MVTVRSLLSARHCFLSWSRREYRGFRSRWNWILLVWRLSSRIRSYRPCSTKALDFTRGSERSRYSGRSRIRCLGGRWRRRVSTSRGSGSWGWDPGRCWIRSWKGGGSFCLPRSCIRILRGWRRWSRRNGEVRRLIRSLFLCSIFSIRVDLRQWIFRCRNSFESVWIRIFHFLLF